MKSFSTTFCWFFAVVIVCAAASTANAQYLADRLVPPQQVPVSPVPMVAQPTEPKVFGSEIPKRHLWALPFSPFPGASVSLATERQAVNWQRLVIDTPVLASELDPARPAFPIQPIAGRAYSIAADPAVPLAPARFPKPVEQIIAVSDDPSLNAAFTLLTAGVPLATPNSAPLMRLAVPDPFEHIAIIRLANSLADSDESAMTQERPPLAKLPPVDPMK